MKGENTFEIAQILSKLVNLSLTTTKYGGPRLVEAEVDAVFEDEIKSWRS